MASNSGVVGILANLSFGRKLGLVLAVMSIPILILAAMFVSARNEDIHHAENEARGVEYIGSLRSVMETLQQHRSLAHAAINGDNSSRARAEQLQPQIDRSVQGVESIESKLGPIFQTADRLAQFKRNWQELKLSAMKVSARDSLENHRRVLDDLYEYVRVIADKSGLILDPKLDSSYLMYSVVNDIPTITERMSRLGYLVNGALASKNPQERLQVQLLAENVDFMIQSLQRNMAVVYSTNSTIEAKLGTSLTSAMRGADPWLRSLKEGNLEKYASGGGAIEGATLASAAFFTLYDAALPNLKAVLEERSKELVSQKYTQLGFAFIVAMLAIALGMVVNRAITGQVQQVNDAFNLIGAGNYDVRVPVTTKDELGNMALSMNSVLDNTLVLIQSREERNRIQNSIQKLLDDISGVASGDLTQEAEVTAEVTGAIADSFNYMISELRAIVRTVNRTTVEVGESAHQVLTTAEVLAHGSQGQARQIAEATTSVDTMVKSIREVSATAGQAASVAEVTFQKAKTGSEAVQKTIQGMGGIRNQVQETSKRLKGLGERSQEIGSIVQLIGDIADRTSILALNASIQAAMAGEAGRGFAVVAEEVERLAERAAEATKKVNALIKSIQADTSEAITAMEETTREVVDGSNLANAAGRALSEIEAVSSQLTNLIRSITATSEEQAAGSDHISKAMAQISTQTKESVEGVKTAATSVQQLATLAEELRHSMQRFRLPSDEPSYVR